MLRRGDERAVTVQIGAVLLLAILFSALALYQLNAVPAENQQVEYTHNQEVRDEMQDLRNAIQNVGTSGGTQSTSVTLGTQYPSRTVAVNPPAARGTLETTGTQTVELENASVNDSYEYTRDNDVVDPDDLDSDVITAHNTTTIAYEPGYNEYDNAPTTRIEHGFAFNDFDDAQVSLTDQPLISNDTIRLVTLEGDLSESGSSAVSLDPTTFSGPSDEIPIDRASDDENITVSIPTTAPTVWEDTVGTTFNDGEAGARVIPDGVNDESGLITIELAGAEYDLQISRVSLDGSGESSDEFDVTTKSQTSGSQGSAGGALALEWDGATVADEQRGASGNETAVTAAPTDNVILNVSAEEYPNLRGAQLDYSFSDLNDIIENDQSDLVTEFEDGTATVEFEIASDASADEEATVLASSGGGLAVATITVEERDDDLTVGSGESRADGNSGVEFGIENTGEVPITLTGLSIDDTGSDATRVNNLDDNEVSVFRDGTEEGWINTDSAESIEIPSGEQDLESTVRFETGDDGTIVIEQFRDDDWFSEIDMSGHTLTVTLYYETESGAQGSEQVEIDIDPFDVEITDVDDEVTAGEAIDVTTEVIYEGSVERTEVIEFYAGNELVETTDVTLSDGDSETVSFSYETDEEDVPELTTTVRTDWNDDSATVVVDEQTLAIDDITITEAGTGNDRFDITADVSDSDGQLDRVEFVFNDSEDEEIERVEDDSISGTTATAEGQVTATGGNTDSEYSIRVILYNTQDESVSETRTVQPS